MPSIVTFVTLASFTLFGGELTLARVTMPDVAQHPLIIYHEILLSGQEPIPQVPIIPRDLSITDKPNQRRGKGVFTLFLNDGLQCILLQLI